MSFMRQALVGLFRLAALVLIMGGAGFVGWQCYRFAGEFGAAVAAGLVFFLAGALGYRNVPTLKLGVVMFLGMRTGRVLDEGPHFVVPLFESVVLLSAEVQTIRVEEQFFCLDRLAAIVEGTLRYRVDKELAATAYFENRHAITDGLADAIWGEIDEVAGANNALAFIGAWRAIGNLVNCSLRMGEPPHVARAVPPEHRLRLYADHDGSIRNHLQSEARLAEERSETENRYGIEVVTFSVGRIRYTAETSAAMEKEGQAVLCAKGHQVTADAKRVIVHQNKEDGLTPLQAEGAAEVVMEKADRKIHQFDGLERFKPIAPPESRTYGGLLCRMN